MLARVSWARTPFGLALARWGQVAVVLAVALAALSRARAQCSVGDYLGSCSSEIGYAGCCPTANSIQWCEGALLCGIDCSGNGGSEDCCMPSDFSGCGNTTIEECVCAIDDFCCDFFSGAWDELCVEIATNDCAACDAGGAPPVFCGWLDSQGYYDCRPAASADPSGAAPRECGAGCAPMCSGKSCGPDGCGGSCGECGAGASCSVSGECESSCTPDCAGKTCGADGCGGLCGQCTSVQTCVAGSCRDPACVPQCEGKACGSDQCGGSCGVCAAGETCTADGACQPNACAPVCGGRACGDDGCGGSCGSCAAGAVCQAGQCLVTCAPACAGKVCGDDGCGGSCGSCGSDETCQEGQCSSACSCVGRACGDDGCGRVCGYCLAGSTCNATTFQCDKLVSETPDAGGAGDATAEPETCPPGQVWSAYAGSCVVDANAGGGRKSDEGCGGAPGAWLGGLALLGLYRRCARRRRTLTAR